MTRSHALLHCPNATLAAARVEAWEGRNPGSRGPAVKPQTGGPAAAVPKTLRSGEVRRRRIDEEEAVEM
jgi:hypothetical protein